MASLSPLANVAATRGVLEEHGLYAKKSLGQNFLVNDDILKRIVELAELAGDDEVLEVGPGIGTLTIALLKNAAHVVSVERDPDLPAVLDDTLDPWRDSFALIRKDALDLTEDDVRCAFASFRAGGQDALAALPDKFVANLPYAVAATVVLDYFERFASLKSATVMVQKEVADRMAADPGNKNYGAYTVKLGLYAQPAGRFAVGPGNFFPPPHVESSVIRLDRRTPAALERMAEELEHAGVLPCGAGSEKAPGAEGAGDVRTAADRLRAATCMMADAAFTNRRKTLANSCKAYFASRGDAGKATVGKLSAIYERAGIDPRRRGETLSQEEFIALGAAYLQA